MLHTDREVIFSGDRCYRITTSDNTPLQRATCRHRNTQCPHVLEADAEQVFWVPHLARTAVYNVGFALQVRGRFAIECHFFY